MSTEAIVRFCFILGTFMGGYFTVLAKTIWQELRHRIEIPKRAKWKLAELENPNVLAFKCSNCGNIEYCGIMYGDGTDDPFDPLGENGLYYCRKCGAKMRWEG